ncbi:MAG: outer membrane protein OmpA-like peptidoglycan-associated protein [Crocinitomicaceae bacterium]|jgi:outer membrane protein OmpA-like peptidoglycan-associated protein/tetratricopeptide (TPR) repeat protein
MKYFLFSITLAFFAACGTAQPGAGGYSVKNKKAIKLLDAGLKAPRESIDHQTNGPNFREGMKLIDQALEKEPNFWEAHLAAAEFEEYLNNYDKAIMHFEKALQINPEHSPSGSTFFFLANLQQAVGDYDGAVKNIDIFVRNRNANPELVNKANEIRANCDFASKAMKNPIDFDPINIGPGINTADPEYFPTITVDGRTILFTRRIEDGRVLGQYKEQEDFYFSELSDKNIWQTAIAMPDHVNTVNNEGAPTIGADGRSLVFVACPDATGKDYGANREGKGSCDLFYTKKLGSRWTTPVNLPGKVNSFHWETQPSLSSDGKTLYFIRGIRGRNSTDNSDIYVSHKEADGTWGVAERLPDYINSPKQEESVLIHPDGKTLYFASRGHVGMGGSDLFMSRKGENGQWGMPENLGYPINTKFDENSLMVSPEGEIAFFASNRTGGFGDLDIYYFQMPEHLRPTRTLYFEGIVFDAYTKKPLPGKFQLIDIKTGKEVVYSEADEETGEFMVSLPVDHEYALNVTYPGYSYFSKNFNMTNPEGLEAIHMDVPLHLIGIDTAMELENVFFDLGLATLRTESFVELDKFTAFLSANPTMKIELQGHTDTRGDDDENLVLSKNRAKAVYDYLVAKGISPEQMTHKGYGETQPRISDEEIAKLTTEAEREAAHQSNRRTQYKPTK